MELKTVDRFFEKINVFFKNNFSISSNKIFKMIGAIVAASALLVVVILNFRFTTLETRAKWCLLAFSLVMPFAIGLNIAYNIKIKHDLLNKICHLVFFLISPIITITMTESLNNVFIYNMTYQGFWANYILVLMLQFFLFAVSGSFKISLLVVNVVGYGLGLAHCLIMMFRGTPFIPWDFLSIKTAAGVANTYTLELRHTIIVASLIFIFMVVLSLKISTPKFNLIAKVFSRTFMGAMFCSLMVLFYTTNVFINAGFKIDRSHPLRSYRDFGFLFSFFCSTNSMSVTTPQDYNHSTIPNIMNDVIGEDKPTPVKPKGDEPNIICIMNESLADLSILGEFEVNQDYMPFMHSLTENTVKGNLYVPVLGAGTCNTEFEFLTSHTTSFLPPGSNAYMTYVNNPLPSLVSTLEGQGYSSWAFHPYYSSGWNRVQVYQNLGFDSFTFLEGIIDSSILADYKQNKGDAEYLQGLLDSYYPDRENMLVRQYISDSYNYDVLINNFENRDKTKPYFAFNITMQNHGGYTTSASNFDECIQITSQNTLYDKTNKYLSLVKASDDAFKKLVEYFENVDEPTVICMFGDHQPTIESDFVASLLGVDVNNLDNLPVEKEQSRYVTPFIIWANYDIEEQYIEKLSVNYLSSYLLDIAELNLTPYNKYLLNLSKTLPVIDTLGYIDHENNYYTWNDYSDHTDLLNGYEQVQYNALFDEENRHNEQFLLEGYVMPEAYKEED